MTDSAGDGARPAAESVVPVDPLRLMDLVSEAVLMHDNEFRIVFANRQAEDLYGWPRAELLGRVIHEILPTRYPNSAPWVADDLQVTGHWAGVLLRMRRDGGTLAVHCRQTAQHENGRLIGVIEVSSDATATDYDHGPASGELGSLLLAGATGYAIFMLDPDGRVASWSASAEQLTGYTEDEIVGAHYGILFTPEAVADGEPRRILARCELGHRDAEGERVRKDGTHFWVSGTITPVHRPDGTLRGFIKVAHDGTERRHAESWFRGLLESAPDALIGADSDGRIVFANTQTELLFGYGRDELLGRPVETLLPARVHAAHIGHRSRFVKSPATRPMGVGLELVALRKDGVEFPVDVSLSALEADDGLIVLATVRDISERKRDQEAIQHLNAALRRANDELELRVLNRTAALAAQASQLRATNAELDAFSYSVSHDLRSPLRAVDGFAKILTVKYADSLDESGQRYLGKVRAGAQHMGQLIDGLLAFSRLQRQPLTRRPVDLVALVDQVWDELESDRADREVELAVGPLPQVYADVQLLRHVVTNLLDNALKYTGRIGRSARISVSAACDDRGDVTYTVRDNGIGFDMRYADKLFKVFQRLHRAEDYEGTGIGLALSARIVQRHGGRMWAEGRVDGGAEFHFMLPHDPPDDPAGDDD